MAAPTGNKYWEFRNKHGRNYKYEPDQLWDEAVKYFEWVEENPLIQDHVIAFQGVATHEPLEKMRAMTIGGFCLFADITFQTFCNYKDSQDFFEVITRIEEIIKEQKFTGAAAELLNPNIIARDLGLSEKTEQTNSGKQEIVVSSKEEKETIDKLFEKLEGE